MGEKANRDFVEEMRRRNADRNKRLDIAPEHRPVLWGEAVQAADDLTLVLDLFSTVLDRARSEGDANG